MCITKKQALAVLERRLGIRSGEKPENAAYGMDDIVGDGQGPASPPTARQTLAWLRDPAEDNDRWGARLWNTVRMIQGLATSGTILVVTDASATAERYRVHGGTRDGYTFAKCPRLPSDSAVVARIHYDAKSKTADLCDAIEQGIA